MAKPVTRESFDVPMGDGVTLATDVYLPGDHKARQPLPVILERTPYDKSGISRSERSLARPSPRTRPEVAEAFASHGYAVVMQDCRGRFASGGEFEKYVNEARDGFDTMAWIASRDWCNGRIGTMGLSYGAHTQCALAALTPPSLACMFLDSGGFSNAYQGAVRQGGAFEMKQATWAYRHALKSRKTAADPARKARLEAADIATWMRRLDWMPGRSPLAAAPEYERYFFDQWQKGLLDDYWKQPGLCAEAYFDCFPDVPVAIVGSWYDPYARSCIRNFLGLKALKTSPVHLLMGPWTHGDRSQTFSGDVDFGALATLDGNIANDYLNLRLTWFDTYLKGVAVAEPAFTAPVSYFCMGGGEGARDISGKLQHGGGWRTDTTWPPVCTEPQAFFCHVDGRLATDLPTHDDGGLQYSFDPSDPVPTIGGAVTSGAPVMQGGAFDQVQTPSTFAVHNIASNRPLAARADVLVFRSEPLAADLTLAGPVVAELWISSNRPDTDFTVKLIDEYPEDPALPGGYAMNLTDGIFRTRYLEGWDREAQLNEDGIYMIRIEAFDTCNRVAKGHRIRVDISSSNYPHFDVNPNTGNSVGDMSNPVVALNTVHCNKRYPSRVVLNVAA